MYPELTTRWAGVLGFGRRVDAGKRKQGDYPWVKPSIRPLQENLKRLDCNATEVGCYGGCSPSSSSSSSSGANRVA